MISWHAWRRTGIRIGLWPGSRTVRGRRRPRAASGSAEDDAAGVPGVIAGLTAGRAQMGVRRSALTLLKLNQVGGFDCPGCAWPEPPAGARSARRVLRERGQSGRRGGHAAPGRPPAFFAAHPMAELAGHTDHWLGQQGRLTEPMVKRAGADHYEPIAWDDAFALIAAQLRGLASPDEALFYTSGRTSNEAAFALPAVRPRLRHQQPPGLLQHVPRVLRRRAHPDDRHRQGHGHPGRRPPGQAARGRRPEPRHQPPAHAARAGEGQAQRRDDRRGQPAARGRPDAASRTRRSRAAWSAPAPRWPTTTCRSGSAATWPCSRRSARCWSSGARSITTFVDTYTDGFADVRRGARPAGLGRRCSPRPG